MGQTADIEVLLTLQRMILEALGLADGAGLLETGIRLDQARELIVRSLREAGRDDLVTPAPEVPL